MKAEAKSDAAAYINETIEEAKLTATKEAKRIIVTSIQRVATETAIENAVTVFNIESDEVKGRIIGREGRNIRALEAATGIEIIVDDTPGSDHPERLRPRAPRDRPSGAASARHRRPNPSRPHRGGGRQGAEADRGGDRRGRQAHGHRSGHPRPASRTDPPDRQDEVPFVLRAKPVAARPRNGQSGRYHGLRTGG